MDHLYGKNQAHLRSIHIVNSTEKMRQKAIYVNLDTAKSGIETLLVIEEKKVKTTFWTTVTPMKTMRYILRNL